MTEKRHFAVLDGLRGVASLTVVMFHLCETYSLGDPFAQIINHGYLAVDFFFMLSGFVIAHAYDDRWGAMSQLEFYKRRLVRLHPMVIVGSLIGAATFYFQSSPEFPLVESTPAWKLVLVALIGATLIPIGSSLDIRGWGEMYPLNGPAWSLFLEYVANMLYAAGLRRLSRPWLSILVAAFAALLIQTAVTSPRSGLIGGWSLDPAELRIGFARLLFPFFGGVLLMRSGLRIRVPQAFVLSSILLLCCLALPRFGTAQQPWINGGYEAACVIFIFPTIVAIGAGAIGTPARLVRFCGAISYPLYITHYPLIYLFTAWISRDKVPATTSAPTGCAVFVASLLIAHVCLTRFDIPVRRWLTKRYVRPDPTLRLQPGSDVR